MKLYQQLEQLFKFRIFSNEEIVPYMVKLSKLGKIDEPKKLAILTLMLDRLGQMEDEANIQEKNPEDVNFIKIGETQSNIPVYTSNIGENAITSLDKGKVEAVREADKCPECGKVCASAFGLQGHMRKHKK